MNSSPYPLLVSYVVLAMNLTVNEMNFAQSPYYIMQDANNYTPSMNKEIRSSEICQIPVPELDKVSQSLINNYLTSNRLQLQYADAVAEWRVMRYNETGHFLEHQDKIRPVEGFTHFGTQIFLPPASLYSFEGGQLLVWLKKKVENIKPHATKWTHIIMPLKIMHRVNKIKKGTRVSYVKSIYVLTKGTKASKQAAAAVDNVEF